MTRKKILAIAMAYGLCSVIATQVNAVVPVTTPSATFNVTGINKSIDRHMQTAAAYMEGFALEHFRSRSVQTGAVDIELFAGPYQLFVSERKPSLAESTNSSGMILASLGLMALIARRRFHM